MNFKIATKEERLNFENIIRQDSANIKNRQHVDREDQYYNNNSNNQGFNKNVQNEFINNQVVGGKENFVKFPINNGKRDYFWEEKKQRKMLEQRKQGDGYSQTMSINHPRENMINNNNGHADFQYNDYSKKMSTPQENNKRGFTPVNNDNINNNTKIRTPYGTDEMNSKINNSNQTKAPTPSVNNNQKPFEQQQYDYDNRNKAMNDPYYQQQTNKIKTPYGENQKLQRTPFNDPRPIPTPNQQNYDLGNQKQQRTPYNDQLVNNSQRPIPTPQQQNYDQRNQNPYVNNNPFMNSNQRPIPTPQQQNNDILNQRQQRTPYNDQFGYNNNSNNQRPIPTPQQQNYDYGSQRQLRTPQYDDQLQNPYNQRQKTPMEQNQKFSNPYNRSLSTPQNDNIRNNLAEQRPQKTPQQNYDPNSNYPHQPHNNKNLYQNEKITTPNQGQYQSQQNYNSQTTPYQRNPLTPFNNQQEYYNNRPPSIPQSNSKPNFQPGNRNNNGYQTENFPPSRQNSNTPFQMNYGKFNYLEQQNNNQFRSQTPIIANQTISSKPFNPLSFNNNEINQQNLTQNNYNTRKY